MPWNRQEGFFVGLCLKQRKKMATLVFGFFVYLVTRLLIITNMELAEGIEDRVDLGLVHVTSTTTTTITPPTTVGHNSSQVCQSLRHQILGIPQSIRQHNCTRCADFTCDNMVFNTSKRPTFYKDIAAWMRNHPKKTLPDQHYMTVNHSCEDFVKKRGYHFDATPEERDFPIAYNILMHRDAEQFERLLRTTYRPHNSYCVHVDQRQSDVLRSAVSAIVDCLPNVFLASEPLKITYAGPSRLQADINCMKDQVASKVKWRYLINLAAQALPLKTNGEIVKILKIFNGANDIEGIYGHRVLRSRFENQWQENDTKIVKTGRKNPAPPGDIRIVRGSAYGTFSRGFVEYILTDRKAIDLLAWSKHTYSPDEHYWATLHHTYNNPHLHPPGGYSGNPNDKPWLSCYSAWGGRDKCKGMWKRGVCIFGVEDLPSLVARKELFANKFYVDHQPLAMECAENWIEYKTRCPPPLDDDYYRKLPFVKT